MSVLQVCRGIWTTGDIVVGKQVGRRTTFFDSDGIADDPTSVTARIRKPSGEILTPVPVLETPGVYLTTFPVFDVKGWWRFVIVGSGGINDVDQGTVMVRAQLF